MPKAYDGRRDPDWWYRTAKTERTKAGSDAHVCRVCGGRYRTGEYGSHKDRPQHRRALR
jgi:hypothetical protein